MPSGVNQQTVHIDSIKQHRHYPFYRHVQVDIVIVGAGSAGLAAAYELS